ncbi:FAD/NAD(P)-binding protein [Hutsoniella sourekii]
MEKVAIIGLGLSGSAVLTAYNKEIKDPEALSIELTIYDIEPYMGRGIPFIPDTPLALLNTRSTDVTYDYQKPGDFGKWIEAREPELDQAPTYASRQLYGQYLYEHNQAHIERLKAQVIHEEVVAIDHIKDQWLLTTQSGETASYDRVHLCCGDLPHHDFYDLRQTPGYIHDPFPLSKLPQTIGPDSRVAVIGTSLSAVDSLKYLDEDRGVKNIYAFSRRNLFPAVAVGDMDQFELHYITEDKFQAILADNQQQLSFEAVEDLFLKELADAGIDYASYEAMVMTPGISGMEQAMDHSQQVLTVEFVATALTRLFNQYWQYMPEADRQAFNDRYSKPMNITKNKIPKESADAIIDARDRGVLSVVDGVKDVLYQEEDKTYQLIDEDGQVLKTVDWIVNATGLDLSLKGDLSAYPLLADLLDSGYAGRESSGGLTFHVDHKTVISPRWGEWKNLHAHGTLISGALYQTNSTYVIQAWAHRLIKGLMTE